MFGATRTWEEIGSNQAVTLIESALTPAHGYTDMVL